VAQHVEEATRHREVTYRGVQRRGGRLSLYPVKRIGRHEEAEINEALDQGGEVDLLEHVTC
jgi:hypothetical protein